MDSESYQNEIDSIYKKHFEGIKLTDSLTDVCGQAGEVYDEIFRLNLDVGYWENPNKFDHDLSYFIAGKLKSMVTNINLIKVSEKALARRITNQILETFKFPRPIDLDPQNYHPDDWAAVNYEEGLRRQGLDPLGNLLPKLSKTLFEQIEEKFLFLSGNLQDVGISIQDKIAFRKQEVTLVINNSRTIGSAQNSNIVQGDEVSLTIKNYAITFNNVNRSDIQELEDIFKHFKSLKEKLQDLNIRSQVKTKVEILQELEDLSNQENLLSEQFEITLSKFTNYYSLNGVLDDDKINGV